MMMTTAAFMCFSAACVATACRGHDVNHASSSQRGPRTSWKAVPALFTRTSSRPKVLTASRLSLDCLGVCRVRLDRECLSAATSIALTTDEAAFHPCCR